ncbi:histidine phosphatase family protein [Fredinandcohnia humi]
MKLYVVRHCEAMGQPPEATLTDRGFEQAQALSQFFNGIQVDRIISSPYKRAIQSIEPLAKRVSLEIELDSRLGERVLSTEELTDWLEKLKATFDDFSLKLHGGESSEEARKRIIELVEKIENSSSENTIIVTHGNIMSLLLNHFDKNFGFEEWKRLSNPDVFLLTIDINRVTVERIWK